MDIIRLYNDYGVEYITGGHRHSRPGWVNTECPFCSGNPGYHLGWNIHYEYYFCWRCGWKATVRTISELINLNKYEVTDLLPKYGINRTFIKQEVKEKQNFKLPNVFEFTDKSVVVNGYLWKRDFHPLVIRDLWGIRWTGPFAKLGRYDYRFRIIIPFFWNGEIVSFDARDYTGKALNKYQACPAEYEIIPHKSILYGNQEYWDTNLGICVEGPTDVWRLGVQAFATSGIQYTHEQVRVMANTFKRIAVIYDDDSQAQVQAKKLVAELKFRNVDAFNVQIKGDPGSLTDKEAKELLKLIK